MMQVLRSIRDFLTPEVLAWLPGRLHTRTCLLLHVSRIVEEIPSIVSGAEQPGMVFSRIEDHYHVFDGDGTYIGEVVKPEWWPRSGATPPS